MTHKMIFTKGDSQNEIQKLEDKIQPTLMNYGNSTDKMVHKIYSQK